MRLQYVAVLVTAALLAGEPGLLWALTLDGNQALNGGSAALNGAGADDITPSAGPVYDWTDNDGDGDEGTGDDASDDLVLDSNQITTTDGTDLIFKLENANGKGIVTGDTSVAYSISTKRTASAGDAGDVKIFGAGDIFLGKIVTEAEVGVTEQATYSGDVIIGQDVDGERVGHVMIANIDVRGDYDNPETGSGNVKIYSTGDVRIQTAAGTTGDILCDWQREWGGAHGGSITIKHDGAFVARNLYTYSASDNYPIPGDVSLDGDTLGNGASGSLTLRRIYTGDAHSFAGGEMGDITIRGYTEVLVTDELNSSCTAGWNGDPAGEIVVTNITGNIVIDGVDLYAADHSSSGPFYDEGDLWLQSSGGSILLGNLDMNRVRYARFDAPDHSAISSVLGNFDTNSVSGTGVFNKPYQTTQIALRAPVDQFIVYDAAANPGLAGHVYKLADLAGNPSQGGRLLPPEQFPPKGTVVIFR